MRSAKVFFSSAKCGFYPHCAVLPTNNQHQMHIGIWSPGICSFFTGWMHYIFLASLNPPFLLPHESQHHNDTDVGSSRLTSSLCDGPRATESSYFAAARTGDWRHWLELTVVTRCKLWTTQTCHSLSGDLLNYDQMRNLTKCTAYWLDYRHQVYILCHKTL